MNSQRPRPIDMDLHTLVAALESAWAELVTTQSVAAGVDCDALVAAIARVPARTQEGLRAKASVVRICLLDGTVAGLIGDGCDGDTALLASFAEDSLAQLEAMSFESWKRRNQDKPAAG
jgi:hypothetical protein